MPKPTFFKTQADLRAWFLKNHDKGWELIIGFYKVGSGKSGATYKQAVDQALCFGWIDGIRRSLDDDSYTNRFTPRKAKSIWSAVNLKRAAELEQAGQMHPKGLAAYHGRDQKMTGQYSFENKDRKLDPAQEKKFRANKKAWAWFSAQAPYYQRTASFWVISAKQEATRDRRLETLIRDSEQGVRTRAFASPLTKTGEMKLPQEYIEIRNARQNNLKGVSLQVPKRKITVFTGVSGSGKSSLVFDTVASEAQRRLYENFSMFVRNFLPRYPQPDADAIENLSMAVIVDQKRLGGGSHSTVGTVTDIAPLLRILFSRVGKPYVGYSNMFSFNDPQGMCPECNGLGRKMGVVADSFLDMDKTLNEGAVQVPFWSNWETGAYAASGFFDNDKKLSKFTSKEMDLLLYGKDLKYKVQMGGNTVNLTYLGILEKINKAYIQRDIKTLSKRTRKNVEPYLTMAPCPLCKGARLNQAALACKIDGYNIADLSAIEVDELIGVVKSIRTKESAPVADALVERLQHLVNIGLEYLSLDRETDTLSGGESQRVKIVKHLTNGLVDAIYIFDEPSVGLHPRDVHRMNELLQALRDKNNTVIVVEHDPEVMRVADYIVDMGPHAGSDGGKIVYEGPYSGLVKSKTLTAQFLNRNVSIKPEFRKPTGKLPIRRATVNNLQNVSVDIPTGVLTAVTGVAGSGKSSLINEAFLKQHPDAVVIDQAPIGVSSRSNPATYTGIMDEVRKTFASANKVNAALFSFNSKGACENCQGLGVTYTDLAMLDGVALPCEVCQGRRFKDEVLEYKYSGKSIADVLDLTIREALEFFEIPAVTTKLQALSDVGLDYLTLGQPLSTLSGGECQRIKLASELHKQGSVYVLDEPTTGLHMSDITHLVAIMDRLVDGGNTVIVIEHNLDIISSADWIIDMGAEGGNKGGKIIFEGTPRDLCKSKDSLTSKYLRQ